MANEGNIHFSITAENDDFKKKLAEMKQGIIDSGKSAQAEGAKIEAIFNRISAAKIDPFAADTINDLVEITTKFQAFETMLANAMQSPLDASALLKPSEWEAIFGDLDALSVSTMDSLIASVTEKANSMVKCGEMSAETYARIMEVVAKADQDMQSRNPFVAVIESAKVAFDQIDKEDNAAVEKRKAAWQTMGVAMGASIGVVAQASQGVGAIAESLGASEETQATVSQITGALSGAASLAKGIATGDISSIISGAVGMITSMIDLFDFRSKNATKLIKMEQGNINKLKGEYKTLENSVDDALGEDYYKQKLAMTKNLQGQIDSAEIQIEAARKIRKKQEREKQIAASEQEKAELILQTKTLTDDLKKEIVTTDLKTLATDLSRSIVEGLVNGAEGIDGVSAIIDGKLDQLIQNMIIKRFEAEIVQKGLKEFFDVIDGVTKEGSDNGMQITDLELEKINDAAEKAKKSIVIKTKTFIKPFVKSGIIDIGTGGENSKDSPKEQEDKRKAEEEKRLKKQEEANKARITAEQNLSKALIEINNETAQAIIDAKEDGVEKELAQIGLNYKLKIDAIEKWEKEQKQKVVEAQRTTYVAKHGTEKGFEIDEEDTNFKTINNGKVAKTKVAENEKDKSEKKFVDNRAAVWAECLIKWGDIEQKRVAITAQYEEKMRNAKTDGEKISLGKELEDSLRNLDLEALQNESPFKTLFGDLGNDTTKQIKAALESAKKLLSESDLPAADLKPMYDAIEKAEEEIRERNPFVALIDSLKDWDSADKKTSLNAVSKGAQASFSLVGDSLGSVVGGLKEMGLAGDEETQKILDNSMNLVGSFADIASMNPAQMVKGIMGAITSISAIFDGRSRRANRLIKVEGDNIKNLQKEYEQAERAVDKALGTDYYQKKINQTANLQKQIDAKQRQIEAEQSKKKKKQNQEQIQAWEDEQKQLTQQIADTKQSVIDELSTTDLKSYSSDLSSSIVDGLVSGADGIDGVSGIIDGKMDDLIKNMITKQFDMLVVQERMKGMFEAMAAGFDENSEDGFGLSKSELQAIKEAGIKGKEGIMSSVDDLNNVLTDIGLDGTAQKQQSATSKGLETMSQETAGELNGTFFSMRNNMSLAKDVLIQLNDTAKMMLAKMNNGESLTDTPRLIAVAVGHLEAIQRNTAHLSQMNDRLGKIETNTSRL